MAVMSMVKGVGVAVFPAGAQRSGGIAGAGVGTLRTDEVPSPLPALNGHGAMRLARAIARIGGTVDDARRVECGKAAFVTSALFVAGVDGGDWSAAESGAKKNADAFPDSWVLDYPVHVVSHRLGAQLKPKIQYLGDLCQRTAEELTALGVSRPLLNNAVRNLAELGLSLGMHIPDWKRPERLKARSR